MLEIAPGAAIRCGSAKDAGIATSAVGLNLGENAMFCALYDRSPQHESRQGMAHLRCNSSERLLDDFSVAFESLGERSIVEDKQSGDIVSGVTMLRLGQNVAHRLASAR